MLDTDIKSCTLKNANEENLSMLIKHNLNALSNIIRYNEKNRIYLFRISSDIIPFGSSPVNTLHWESLFQPALEAIGSAIKKAGMRVSMHPGQYTVLNSKSADVVSRAVLDLEYHNSFLDSLGMDAGHKIILHIGGVYGDKRVAIMRFCENYRYLSDAVKKRLVIENDDVSYTIEDVLKAGTKLGLPVVYDNLHNAVNGADKTKSDAYWISQCAGTWKDGDGNQKIHYSQQDTNKKPGSHSGSIKIKKFLKFYEELNLCHPDIMLEVKDKNLSAVKCINCTAENGRIGDLEAEWSRYKYNVLESMPENYIAVRKLLKNKASYPAAEFYYLLEEAMEKDVTSGNAVNAAMHVWGYFRKKANEKEKAAFFNDLQAFGDGQVPIKKVKNDLRRLALKYRDEYLLNSLYFALL